MANMFDDLIPTGPGGQLVGGGVTSAGRAPAVDFSDLIPGPKKPFNILPFSEDDKGKVSFDYNAGLLGLVDRVISTPLAGFRGELGAPTSPEAIYRGTEMATAVTPMNPAMRAGDRAIPGILRSARQAEPKAPTAGELKAASGNAYDAFRATGAEYPGQSVANMAGGLVDALNQEGLLAVLAPKTHAVLNELRNAPAGSVATAPSLEAARKTLGGIEKSNSHDYGAAQRAIKSIDQLIEGAGSPAGAAVDNSAVSLVPAPAAGAGAADRTGAGGVAENPLEKAARLIREARGNAAANFRSRDLTRLGDTAENRALASNSGQNIGNTIRQKLATFLDDEEATRGFSKGELDAIREVVRGTATSNTLRRVSNWLGGGGGVGQSIFAILGATAGSAIDGPTGAAIGGAIPVVTGQGTRSAYNALVRRQLDNVNEMVRERSPLYQQKPVPLQPSLWDVNNGFALRGLLGAYGGGLLGDQP